MMRGGFLLWKALFIFFWLTTTAIIIFEDYRLPWWLQALLTLTFAMWNAREFLEEVA